MKRRHGLIDFGLRRALIFLFAQLFSFFFLLLASSFKSSFGCQLEKYGQLYKQMCSRTSTTSPGDRKATHMRPSIVGQWDSWEAFVKQQQQQRRRRRRQRHKQQNLCKSVAAVAQKGGHQSGRGKIRGLRPNEKSQKLLYQRRQQ